MSRVFAYCRVSTSEQTPENQVREIEAAGFKVQPNRVISETVSGSSAIDQRKGFTKLPVVSRRHFFSMAPDWRHVRATMMVDLADRRGFVGERR